MINNSKVKYLKDYTQPDYLVDNIFLTFILDEDYTIVKSTQNYRKNSNLLKSDNNNLKLDGNNLELISISLNNKKLSKDEYSLTKDTLEILNTPDSFELKIENKIKPQENTSLSGLYKSGNMFCTQCEAEGFRNITYFQDRPDVMSCFTCKIIADKDKYPILLSNGNLIDKGDNTDNKHWALWEDPFKKPSYLFALVAGNLVFIEDTFKTMSGREVLLKIFVEKVNIDKCDHAMYSLKQAMKWDEVTYKREYDLDLYMIVAVNDFNMGAMENKGLNIFNSKVILAKPETATDSDYQTIQAVIGHEYFHNWTGNRITLKNWFQVSLKEGLTVFRDQQFTSDMVSGPVKRIQDVKGLRSSQFPEDSGPLSHNVRPDSYIEINNFYTHTVYEKGAEIIRMMYIILGKQNFYKAMDLYFERFDGQAVTCEDFVKTMEHASGIDLSQFWLWYIQAGTPTVSFTTNYDNIKNTFSITFSQDFKKTPGQDKKFPLHIPIVMGLLDKFGNDLELKLENEKHSTKNNIILNLKEKKQTFIFENILSKPVASVFRGFSAPVKINSDYSDNDFIFLLENDSDTFNRWDAGQTFFSKIMLKSIYEYQKNKTLSIDNNIINTFKKLLNEKTLDKKYLSNLIVLPSESGIGQLMYDEGFSIDPDAIHIVRQYLITELSNHLYDDFFNIYYENLDKGEYLNDQESIAKRSLKNTALLYLSHTNNNEIVKLIFNQFIEADNMTDELASFNILSNIEINEKDYAIKIFYNKWKHDPLVIDKWFAIQAGSISPDTIKKVKQLTLHKDFTIKNPNRFRALIGTFSIGNPFNFHNISGEGYEFLADHIILIDKINPQIAARVVAAFNQWKKYCDIRQKKMKEQLEKIINIPDLSKDCCEIVSKSLQ